MKIVFWGTPDFAVVSLSRLVGAAKYEVCGVVTVPDKPKGRGRIVSSSPVKKFAVSHNIEVLQPEFLTDPGFIEKTKSYNSDIFVVVAFRILPKEVFTIPPAGTINVHASLLPKYRGAAPINWAIMNGESETGVTTMLINEKVDTGNLLLQRKVLIGPEMTAGELHDSLAEIGANLLVDTIEQVRTHSIEPKIQDDQAATKAPKIKKDTCHLNFGRPAADVHNQIRGLSPYPAAFCFHKDKQIKVYRSRIANTQTEHPEPGIIENITKDFIRVRCGTGSVDLLEVCLEGKKKTAMRDFLNGYHFNLGDALN